MLALAILTAFAAEPTAGLHGVSAFGPGTTSVGAGGSYGLNVSHFDFELAADGAFGQESVVFVRPRARWTLLDPRAMGPHLVAGGGVLFLPDGEDAALEAGVGFDFFRTPVRPRIQALYAGLPGGEQRALVTLGIAWRKAPPPPPAPVELPRFDAAMVWVPGPVCQWLPPDEASEAFAEVDADAANVATITMPDPVERRTDDILAQPMGDLVVAAYPGDQVSIGDETAQVAADGIAWASRPEGPATVRIVGGGRREVLDVAVSSDATLWVATTEPGPVELRFELGSAELEGPSAITLDALADTLGDWHVHIWGSFSAEGDQAANERLALRRAESAQQRLLVAGIPEERVHVLPPRRPDDGKAPEEQRVAIVQPVAPGTAPQELP